MVHAVEGDSHNTLSLAIAECMGSQWASRLATLCVHTSQWVMSGATLHIVFRWKGNPSDH